MIPAPLVDATGTNEGLSAIPFRLCARTLFIISAFIATAMGHLDGHHCVPMHRLPLVSLKIPMLLLSMP